MYSKGVIFAGAIRLVRGHGDKFEVVTALRTFQFRAEREGTWIGLSSLPPLLPVVFSGSDLLDPGLVFHPLISHDLPPPPSLVFVSASFMLPCCLLNNSAVIVCLASDVCLVPVVFQLSERLGS